MKNIEYFSDWNNRASVRVKEAKYDCKSAFDASDKEWFLPGALSILKHPAFPALVSNDRQRLLAQNLVFFLDYTTVLEHQIVNQSVHIIAHNRLPVETSRIQKENALRLYTDEGFHALISADIANQVRDLFHLPSPDQKFDRICNLYKRAHQYDGKSHALAWFLTGFVCETVITKEFLRMGQSVIVEPVFQMLRDHLEDEWGHSRYFAALFADIWRRLSEHEQVFCAQLLPKIILDCFSLEKNWLAKSLLDVGVATSVAQEIIDESCSPNSTVIRAREGWQATFQALQASSFFESPFNREIFTSYGLLSGNEEIFR